MPSPYDYMQNRWLTWHERWPVPEIESLKRQIDNIKLEISNRESARRLIEESGPAEFTAKTLEMGDRNRPSIGDLKEVLATLERLMPPF